jgi:hypothetical protein
MPSCSPPGTPTVWSFEVEKTTPPASLLKVDFPIHSGAIQFYEPTTGGQREITLDIRDDVPIYYKDGKAHSPDEIADFLLNLLFPDPPPAPKKQIGFHPV